MEPAAVSPVLRAGKAKRTIAGDSVAGIQSTMLGCKGSFRVVVSVKEFQSLIAVDVDSPNFEVIL